MNIKGLKLLNIHVYWQYVIMYLIIIGIIILALTPIYYQAQSISKRVYLQEVYHNLVRSSDNFEKSIEAAWQIHNIMNQSDYYTKMKLYRGYKLSSEYYIYMDFARRFFTNQCNTVGLEEESFIVFRNSGAAITRNTICESVDKCFTNQIIYDELSTREILEKIYNIDYCKTFIPASGVLISDTGIHDRYLTLLTGQQNDSAVIGTLFSEDKLYDIFNLNNLPSNLFFYITDTRNNILISKNSGRIPSEISNDTASIAFNGVDYNVIQYSMGSIGFKVVIGIPDSYINNLLVPLKALNIRYVIVAALMGILLSIIFTLYNYIPLKKIMDIPLAAASNGKLLQTNEYSCISELIKRSDDEIQKLRNNIRNMDNTLRVNLFVSLLHGNVNAESEINLLKQLIPQLLSEYRIAIVKMNVLTKETENIDYLSFLVYEQLSGMLSDGFLFGQLDRTKTAVLIPGTQHSIQHFSETIKQINSIISINSITLTAGISELQNDIDKINTAFYHAQSCLLEDSKESICYFQAVTEIEPLSIDLVGLQRLNELIQAGKCSEVSDMLEKISFSLIKGGSYSCEDVRKTYYVLRFVLESVIKNLQFKNVNLPEYKENQTVKELFTALSLTVKEIVAELEDRKQNENIQLKRDILNYVNNNFSSSSMYVASVSDAIGISEGYVYKLIKECTGYTLNDYIRKLRAEKAAKMLKETDLPVCSISDICGFDVLRTFYRDFRKHYGVTPSQFRQNYNMQINENIT